MSVRSELIKANKAMLDFCGISEWHDKGITGKRGKTVSYEPFDISDEKIAGLGKDPLGVCYKKPHGLQTAVSHMLVAPEREIYSMDNDFLVGSDGKIRGTLVSKVIPWILKNKPDVSFWSQTKAFPNNIDSLYAPTLGYFTQFAAIGNRESRTTRPSRLPESETWYGVGAANLQNGEIVHSSYSLESDAVDFTGIDWLVVDISPETGTKTYAKGTSFACPWIAGTAALVNDLMLSRGMPVLTAFQMYVFLKAHSVDIPVAGKDKKTGWGYVKLPAPKTAENELFHLTKQADKLYAQEKAAGSIRHTAQYFIDLVKSGRA